MAERADLQQYSSQDIQIIRSGRSVGGRGRQRDMVFQFKPDPDAELSSPASLLEAYQTQAGITERVAPGKKRQKGRKRH